MSKLLIGALIGLCLGALIGGMAFGALASDTTATAFLRLKNPADLTAIAAGASQITPDNQSNTATFAAGEIAYLSGEGFAQAVADKMARDEPVQLNVAQAGESSVITISCSSRSGDEAVRTVQTAIDLYGQKVAQRMDEQLRTILPRLIGWQERDLADSARIHDLQRLRESVELQATEASTLLVVQPPSTNHPSSQQWVIGALLGGLVGASGAVAVQLARRRRSGRGALVKTVTERVDGLLLPAVDLDVATAGSSTDRRIRLARSLFTQCPAAESGRLILVIGVSASSGSAEVAALLETAAAENPPAVVTGPSSGQHWSAGGESSATRILHGGVVGDSTLTPDVIGAASDIVLVARLDDDTVAGVLAPLSATASSAAPVLVVFTYRGRRASVRRARPKPEAAAA